MNTTVKQQPRLSGQPVRQAGRQATTRRSWLRKLFLGGATALGLAPLLRPRRADAAPLLDSSTLSGTTTVPAGATLNIASGASIVAQPGATITGFPTGGGGGDPDEALSDIITRLDELTPHFAVFEIPLGIDSPNSGPWTDFELKGSVNNFNGVGSAGLCYFYSSVPSGEDSTHSRIGVTAIVFFTEDLTKTDHAAARQWRKQLPTDPSIFEMLSSPSATVGGVLVAVPICQANPGIHPKNDGLKFVFQRVSPTAMEETWVPIMPKWYTTAPEVPFAVNYPASTPGANSPYDRSGVYVSYALVDDGAGNTAPVTVTLTMQSDPNMTDVGIRPLLPGEAYCVLYSFSGYGIITPGDNGQVILSQDPEYIYGTSPHFSARRNGTAKWQVGEVANITFTRLGQSAMGNANQGTVCVFAGVAIYVVATGEIITPGGGTGIGCRCLAVTPA